MKVPGLMFAAPCWLWAAWEIPQRRSLGLFIAGCAFLISGLLAPSGRSER